MDDTTGWRHMNSAPRDGSRILVASDGEVRGEGDMGSQGNEYTSGDCTRGGQAV